MSPQHDLSLEKRRDSLWLWLSLGGFALLHLFLLFRFPLAPDETYYWQWSRHLDWGYYDQGPLVAWWIRAFCGLFGETPLGVRGGIVAAAFGTQAFLTFLARDLFGMRVALLSLLLGGMTPLVLAGSFVATYDPLMVLFWASALYFCARLLFFGSNRAVYGIGLSLGLGLLSKHTMLLLAPCLAFFLWTLPAARPRLDRRHVSLLSGLALLLFLPNLLWQSHNGWMTFRHLFVLTGKGLDQPFLRRFGDFIGSQVGLITPLLFLAFISALIWVWKRWRMKRPAELTAPTTRLWFLFCFSAPILGFFLLLTLKSKVQANWAVNGWLTAPICYAVWVEEMWRQRTHRKAQWRLCFAALAALFCFWLSLILILPESRSWLGIRTPAKWDQMNKMYGGAELAEAVAPVRSQMDAEAKALGKRPVALGAATYDNASRLAFCLPDKPETFNLFLDTRASSYLLWNTLALPKPGENALVVDDLAPNDPKRPLFEAVFERIVPEYTPIQVYRAGVYAEPIHTFYLYRCYGYRPNEDVEKPKGG